MGAPTGTVNFFSPQALVAPDLTVQQAQVDRAQQLAAALRQMSMEPIDAGRGAISWTQGLTKIADALAGRVTQNRADKQQSALSQAFAARLGPMFGGGANTDGTMSLASPKGGDPASSPVPPQATPAPSAPLSTAPQMPITPVDPDAAPQSPAPSLPAQTPSQPSQAAGASSPGPWSLTGDPQRDMALWMGDQDGYMKAVIAKQSPADFTKLLQQSGIDPNSPLGRQLMQSQVAKQNYIAPINGRPGATIRDPNDPSRVLGYDAPSIEGAFPTYGPDGMPTGYQQAPGAQQAIAGVTGAKAGATAAAQAPYDMMEVVDAATGEKHWIAKSALTGGGATGAPTGGGLNGYYGHGAPAPSGNVSGLGPGQTSASSTAGTNSANGFNEAIQGGVNAKNAMRTINNITSAANGLPTGTGSGVISEGKSAVNAISGAFGGPAIFDRDQIARFDEMKKNAATLGEQLSSAAAGGGGTDARLKNALDSLPGAHYSPQAIQEVGTNLKALQAAALGRSQAAARYMQANGPNSFPAFQSAWQQAYNPDIFYHMQKNDVAAWSRGMTAADRDRVMTQYRQMKAMGAF